MTLACWLVGVEKWQSETSFQTQVDLKIPEHLPLPLDKFERPKRRGSPVVVVVLSGYLNPSESASPDAAKPRTRGSGAIGKEEVCQTNFQAQVISY